MSAGSNDLRRRPAQRLRCSVVRIQALTELQVRPVQAKAEPRCGVYVVDTRSGDIVHWLQIEVVVNELYDVVALPGGRR